MAGGPILPSSAFPVTAGESFVFMYSGAGSTEDTTEMYGVQEAAAIAGDVVLWHLLFQMPEVLPSGTATLKVRCRANTTSADDVGLNIQWVSVAETESPDDATMNDEGSLNITASTTADQYFVGTLTLDADTIVAGELLHMNIEVDDSEHTITADTGMLFSIIWV